MALGLLGFLLHIQYTHLVINDDDTRTPQLLQAGLLMTHDAGGLFLLSEVDELLE